MLNILRLGNELKRLTNFWILFSQINTSEFVDKNEFCLNYK